MRREARRDPNVRGRPRLPVDAWDRRLRRAVVIFSIVASVSALLALAPAGGDTAPEIVAYKQVRCAKAPCPQDCPRGFTAMPDDRPSGGVLCISDRERARARKICKDQNIKDWRECTCQDGNKIGACGD